MTRNRMLGWLVAVAASAALPAAAYTSASYVQDGLIAQWDAIDNEGIGTHNPNATVWKDLAGHNDLTIVEGHGSEWRRGIAFYMNTRTSGLAAAYGTEAATTYKTMQTYSVVPSKLVIDPSAFDTDRRGRKQTLLSCAKASAESLQRLVDNVEFVNAARHGTVTIEDGGTRLVYNGLSGRTMVIVR